MHMDNADLWLRMNAQIVEAVVHQQVDCHRVWCHGPDHDPVFLALAYARRGDAINFSPFNASHYACMAVRFDADESRTGSAAFKGLRRWRNVVDDVVTDLTLTCVWRKRGAGRHTEPPRHHQLWHLRRLTGNQQQQQRATFDAAFLLLVGVMNDHVFAAIPPEDAADAVVTALYTKCPLTTRHAFDLGRLLDALAKPRTPYLAFLFPDQALVPLETWHAILTRPSPPAHRP